MRFLATWQSAYLSARRRSSNHTQPAFLEDPRLCLSTTSTSQVTNFTEASSGETTTNVLQNLQQEVLPKLYTDLDPQSQQLDVVLYTTLCTIVKGGILKIISELRGANARYTFAIIAPHRTEG